MDGWVSQQESRNLVLTQSLGNPLGSAAPAMQSSQKRQRDAVARQTLSESTSTIVETYVVQTVECREPWSV